jgi:putative YphP/YqiW family bacilliredoxin
MREELASRGFIQTRTPEEVDQLLSPGSGTVLMVVNSVCGCAAGRARPGVILSLQQAATPDKLATVFAGADVEAVARVRERLAGYPPSSPSVALFQDGQPVFMLHRHEIEGREAPEIASILAAAYERHCAKQASVE